MDTDRGDGSREDVRVAKWGGAPFGRGERGPTPFEAARRHFPRELRSTEAFACAVEDMVSCKGVLSRPCSGSVVAARPCGVCMVVCAGLWGVLIK